MASRFVRAQGNARPIVMRRARRLPREFRPVNAQWKVAYADFSTAMMAFFMLLWLLSAAKEGSLEGLADYFNPSRADISSSSGAGSVLSGASPIGAPGARASGAFDSGLLAAVPPAERGDDGLEAAREAAAAYEKDMRAALAETPETAPLAGQVLFEPTPEGVRIQLVDSAHRPLFRPRTAEPYPYAKRLFRTLAGKIARLPTRIAVEGHTVGTGDSSWRLSAERALAVRSILASGGVSADRFAAASGRGPSEPLYPDATQSPENTRITVLLLNEPPAAPPEFGRRPAKLPSQSLPTAP
jgi:chemotaxis protein MotB